MPGGKAEITQQPMDSSMTTWHLPRFHIHGLMWVIAFLAAGLALNRWPYPLLTLLIMVFPASVLAERFFGTRPKVTDTCPTIFAFAVRVVVVLLCGCLSSALQTASGCVTDRTTGNRLALRCMSCSPNGWSCRHRFSGHVFQGRYRTAITLIVLGPGVPFSQLFKSWKIMRPVFPRYAS
jgi:hypothetical protein